MFRVRFFSSHPKCLIRAAIGVLVAACLWAWPVNATPTSVKDAAELINKGLSDREECRKDGALTVGFHPFKDDETPLSKDVSELLHKEILSQLINSAPNCVSYISITGAGQVLDAIHVTGELRKEGAKQIQDIEAGIHSANLALIGAIYELNQKLFLELSLLNKVNGRTIVNTGAVAVPNRYGKRICGDGSLDLEAAAADIGRHFKAHFSKVRILVPDGISYGNTDIQTEFSDYVSDLLQSELSNVYWDELSKQGLSIRTLDDNNFEEIKRSRGLTLTPNQVEQTRLKIDGSQGKSLYHLSGRYWPCGEDKKSANISISMTNPQGERWTWKNFVKLDTLPGNVSLKPKQKTSQEHLTNDHWNAPAQFSFDMSSNRGKKPAFVAGEELFLTIRSEQDAWLYCFYTDSSGQMVQFLPNPTLDQHDPNRNLITGKRLHIIPDHQKQPVPDNYNLKIDDSTVGAEAIKCIAVSRNVTRELPVDLQGQAFQVIPQHLSMRLRQIFDRLPDAKLAEENLTITIRNSGIYHK